MAIRGRVLAIVTTRDSGSAQRLHGAVAGQFQPVSSFLEVPIQSMDLPQTCSPKCLHLQGKLARHHGGLFYVCRACSTVWRCKFSKPAVVYPASGVDSEVARAGMESALPLHQLLRPADVQRCFSAR